LQPSGGGAIEFIKKVLFKAEHGLKNSVDHINHLAFVKINSQES
jgi:hypothetical protein